MKRVITAVHVVLIFHSRIVIFQAFAPSVHELKSCIAVEIQLFRSQALRNSDTHFLFHYGMGHPQVLIQGLKEESRSSNTLCLGVIYPLHLISPLLHISLSSSLD